MDFTGKAGGRIIENPTEAQNAEQEEAQAWRVRENKWSYTFSFNSAFVKLKDNRVDTLINKPTAF